MLREFITTHRDAIIARTRDKLNRRTGPSAAANELEHGVPLFLTQLSQTLPYEQTATPFSATDIAAGATRHARDLLARGFTVAQIVHDYGDICQAISELAVAEHAAITAEELHTLNRCLDTAIAEAVTEHARLTADASARLEIERSGRVAHQVRDMVSLALLAYRTLQLGSVGINGSTGTILGQTLMRLRDFADSTLSDVRIQAHQQRRERVLVTAFLSEIVLGGRTPGGVPRHALHRRAGGSRMDHRRGPAAARDRRHQSREQRVSVQRRRRPSHAARARRGRPPAD